MNSILFFPSLVFTTIYTMIVLLLLIDSSGCVGEMRNKMEDHTVLDGLAF